MSKTGLASVLLLVSVSTAVAQPAGGTTVIVLEPGGPAPQGPGAQPMPPGQPMAMAPAPQNESWSNVSHINGTPVPVGTRNEYVYKFRRTNLSINPVGWMMGFYSASLSHALSDNLAIRGDIAVFSDPDNGDDGFTEVGIGLPLYLRRTYQGPFIEPGLISRSWEDGDETRGPQMLVGWHWSYDSGWNMSAALGGGRDFSRDEYEGDSDSEPFFNGYFRVGYAF